MRKLLFAILCLTIGISNPQPAQAAQKLESFEKLPESTVRVVVRRGNRTGYGSGWVVVTANPDRNAGLGTIITAYHVIKGARNITIIEPDGEEAVRATVKHVDPSRDIAILEIKDLALPALTISSEKPPIGTVVRSTGYQAASDRQDEEGVALTASLKSGEVSRAFRGKGSLDLIEHGVALNPGYSGGPLFDACGRVVGMNLRNGGFINLGKAGTINLAQGVGTAIAANEILKVAEDENVSPITTDNSECGEAIAEDEPNECQGEGCGDAADEDVGNSDDEATSLSAWIKDLGTTRLIAIAVLLLGIIGAAVAIFMLTRSREENDGYEDEMPGEAPGGSEEAVGVGVLVGAKDAGPAITLSGVSPQGQSINLNFSASELQQNKKLLGSEPGEVDGLVNDERADRFVSRVHARLGHDGHSFTITDMGSPNGTFISDSRSNERKLDRQETGKLQDGDTVRLADVKLQVKTR